MQGSAGSERRRRALQLAWTAGIAGLAVFAFARLDVTHGITQFLPAGEQSRLLALATRIAESELARSTVLSISSSGSSGADSQDLLVAASARLAARIDELPEVERVVAAIDDDAVGAVHALYFPRRLYLASEDPEREIASLLGDGALAARAAALHAQLALPTSLASDSLAPADPLALFERVTSRLRDIEPGLVARGGQLLTTDGRHAILLVEGRHSPFDSEHQGPLQAGVEAALRDVSQELDASLVLEQSGIGRLALDTEKSIRNDLKRISALSLLGVSALYLLLFRSARSLVLAIAPALVGFAFAIAVSSFFVPQIHGVTLAFGASLIGVAIDYSIHLINHHGLLPGAGGPRATLARLRPSLVLGAGTTLAGFGGLALTSFPGVREMGLFAMAGIAGALLATLWGLPTFLREREPAGRVQRETARWLGQRVDALRRRPHRLLALPLLALGLGLLGIPRIEWLDDPSALSRQSQQLLDEDARVRERAFQVETGRFVVAFGVDPQQALARNDAVWTRLQPAIEAGHLAGVRSLHTLLWSEELQRRNLAAFRSEPGLPRRIDAAFVAAGFRPGAFEPFARALADPDPPPLRPADLDGTPFERIARSMLVELEGHTAAITYLRGVNDPDAVGAALAGLEGVRFFDQPRLLEELYASYRVKTLELIAAGYAGVLALLWLRYRAWQKALAAFAPSLGVVAAELGLFGLLGVPIDLIGLASLILILGMGVDYGIFVVDSADDPEHLGATLLSLLASCLTTLFVFGTLALSSQPALRSIGLTTGVGILLAFALAPSASLWSGRGRPRGRP